MVNPSHHIYFSTPIGEKSTRNSEVEGREETDCAHTSLKRYRGGKKVM
jgi:hypothetical protein